MHRLFDSPIAPSRLRAIAALMITCPIVVYALVHFMNRPDGIRDESTNCSAACRPKIETATIDRQKNETVSCEPGFSGIDPATLDDGWSVYIDHELCISFAVPKRWMIEKPYASSIRIYPHDAYAAMHYPSDAPRPGIWVDALHLDDATEKNDTVIERFASTTLTGTKFFSPAFGGVYVWRLRSRTGRGFEIRAQGNPEHPSPYDGMTASIVRQATAP